MGARWTLAISAAIGLAGCPKREAPATDPPPKSGTGDTAVTTTTAGDSWDQALEIAKQSGASGLARWAEDVPYLFQARGSRGVLVHKGAIVTARGPAAVGAYLRDVGILEGKGPSPGSILTLLYVLHAFPAVEGLPEQSAIDMLGIEELRPRVEAANGRARVILHYWLPRDPGPARDTVPVMRETLDIGPTGDAAWTGEKLDYPRP